MFKIEIDQDLFWRNLKTNQKEVRVKKDSVLKYKDSTDPESMVLNDKKFSKKNKEDIESYQLINQWLNLKLEGLWLGKTEHLLVKVQAAALHARQALTFVNIPQPFIQIEQIIKHDSDFKKYFNYI